MLILWISWINLAILSFIIGYSTHAFLAGHFKLNSKEGIQSLGVDHFILTGFLLVSGLCSWLSLVIPVNLWLLLPLWVLAAGLAYINRRALLKELHLIRVKWLHSPAWIKWGSGMFFLIVSWYTLSQAYHHSDLELYHAQSLEWIRQYAVVPGLGNIHGRFAFNSHYFVASALYAIPLGPDRILYPVFSFFFLLLAGRLWLNMRTASQKGDWQFFLVNALLLILVSFQCTPRLKCLSTDDITCVFIIYLLLIFWKQAFSFKNKLLLFLFALILFSTITYKLSSVFLVFFFPFVLWKLHPKYLIRIGAMGLLIGLPFVIRNIYLSGYLIYPFPGLDVINVDWKIPMDWVIFEEQLVKGWASQPSLPVPEAEAGDILDMPLGEWLMQFWAERLSLRWKFIYIVNLLAIPLFGLTLFKRQYKLAALFGIMLINLGFWFYQAPDPRFAYAFLFFNFSLVIAYLFQTLPRRPHLRLVSGLLPLVAFCALLAMVLKIYKNKPVFADNINMSILLIPPNHTAQNDPVVEFQARNFTLFVPSNFRCFTNPIPCTMYPKADLEMRGDTFLEGFRIRDK